MASLLSHFYLLKAGKFQKNSIKLNFVVQHSRGLLKTVGIFTGYENRHSCHTQFTKGWCWISVRYDVIQYRENEAIKHDLVEFKVQCLKVFCYYGNKSTILLFHSIFRTTPEVSSKLYFVKSQRS